LPSIVRLLRVEASNQPALTLPAPTILPQSSIRPLTRYDVIQLDFADVHFGRVAGQKIVVLMPQEVAYAASAAPAYRWSASPCTDAERASTPP
jgi:hypothetical protein